MFLSFQVAVIHNAERCEAFAAEFAVYEDLWSKDMRTSLEAWLEEKTTTNEGMYLASIAAYSEFFCEWLFA